MKSLFLHHVVEEEGPVEGIHALDGVGEMSAMADWGQFHLQVIILGDSGVGKTSLMNQYVCMLSNPPGKKKLVARLRVDRTRLDSLYLRHTGQQEVQHKLQSHHWC